MYVTYCSFATIFMASTTWAVTLELRYWRVGAPWVAAMVGMATLSPVRSAEAARELPAVAASGTKDLPTMVVAAVGVPRLLLLLLLLFRLSCARRLGSTVMVTSPAFFLESFARGLLPFIAFLLVVEGAIL